MELIVIIGIALWFFFSFAGKSTSSRNNDSKNKVFDVKEKPPARSAQNSTPKSKYLASKIDMELAKLNLEATQKKIEIGKKHADIIKNNEEALKLGEALYQEVLAKLEGDHYGVSASANKTLNTLKSEKKAEPLASLDGRRGWSKYSKNNNVERLQSNSDKAKSSGLPESIAQELSSSINTDIRLIDLDAFTVEAWRAAAAKKEDSSSSRDIKSVAASLNIENLYHFTNVSNLESIFERGILSVSRLREMKTSFLLNDEKRYDGRFNRISASISFPNEKMFYKYRMLSPNEDWALIRLDVRVLYELDCLFCPYNAADKRISISLDSDLRGGEALRAMIDNDSESRPGYLEMSDPTDVQAEVLILDEIPVEYITAVGFDSMRGYLRADSIDSRGIPLIHPSQGQKLFGLRRYARGGYPEGSGGRSKKNGSLPIASSLGDDEIPF